MRVLAITDHDIRPPEKIRIDPVEGSLIAAAEAGPSTSMMDAVDYAWSRGLRLIRGIEISCGTTVEDCHIVCLGCDWKDPYFDELAPYTLKLVNNLPYVGCYLRDKYVNDGTHSSFPN